MQFSEYFDIDTDEDDEWFDPILDTDTRLFVDPFLIFKESDGLWSTAHAELIEYFDRAFNLLSGYEDSKQSLQYRRVVSLMKFPEPQEFCLGYVGTGTRGSGAGTGLAKQITEAMRQAIKRGLDKGMAHFEELGVLVERVNRDRISDITLSILKPKFIDYTQKIASELGIEVEPVEVTNSVYDAVRKRWVTGTFDLPRNPGSGKAILLVPKRFLRELPTLNPGDWYEYSETTLRDDMNLTVMENVDTQEIVRLARSRSDLIREWTMARETSPAKPYGVNRDVKGLHNWNMLAANIVSDHPISPQDGESIHDFVGRMVAIFKHYIEHERGWPLLYNEDTGKPKREESVQLLFKGIVQHYCRANGVRIDREVYVGKGPVDFAFTKSAFERVLLEIKKMTNTDYWDGLEKQLISYLASDYCDFGWFLAVRYDDKPVSAKRTNDLASRTESAGRDTGFDLRSEWIDARPKASASNL
ncbi:hypothetical protein ACHIPZ_10400 [Antrihabitans sp. NCIMB 15449]|uniref:Restriction endonuclease n=1 Tax=Antrihabitans spumae TaxID=3373370 RepID=A0ABW7JND9_9NOCA